MPASSFEKLLRRYFPFGFPTTLEAVSRFELVPFVAAAEPDHPRESVREARDLAHHLNRKKALATYHPEPIRAEDLFALGLLSDALRYVVLLYGEQEPGVLATGRRHAEDESGEPDARDVPIGFVRLLPPRDVVLLAAPVAGSLPPVESDVEYSRRTNEFIEGKDRIVSNRDGVMIETVLLALTTENPAAVALRELFDDTELQERVPFVPYVVAVEEFFERRPPFRLLGDTLFRCLRAPMRASPHSLEGQLRYIRSNWAHFLPRHILERITLALDVWEEDRRLRGLGPGPMPVLEFGRGADSAGEPEFEAFSIDRDWMSNLVLIAKNIHVWLDQLSRKHGRHLRLLSDVPDEELDRLARWGFRGLWLIGLWERSRASRRIKQYMGNPEAEASAYSLREYEISLDLGGEEAWRNLRDRAWQRGIRLASDMVPNHMGIDSRWVIEHPHWFIQLPEPPYPWYSFTGGDLSDDPRVGLQIEDGYWERRDAAVVFRRIDRHTGETRYIYHGNDGTSMPWNDTAQLDYLLPEVREAVIQTILHVARHFPIIRFDAAMTLAKRHYQRLWFPQPGDAGAIPSRAEQGMSKTDFDRRFPVEFWREVVDRVAAEAPDTLLLAEAFWLMEGYFVRTLGMHRVYNSAFMNMLKMEENAAYRQTIKNVLEFSPEVLKRFVNFMNNPDERTAVEQFGKGDKYFGVCLLMVTMPGLPMFGHGQIEGFTEKYGMEYRRAYWDEQADEHLVARHEAEIFPLMRRRRLFSGAENFAFFDFVRADGNVDENVFAYTNRAGGERAVILYNNAYDRTAGAIHASTAINTGSVDAPYLVRRSLVEALALEVAGGCYYSFRDHRTGLEYLRSGSEIAAHGLFARLDGYQWHAFLDWREIRDESGRWGELARRLGGGAVPSVEIARREMDLEPVLGPYRLALDAAIALAAHPEGAEEMRAFDERSAAFARAAALFGEAPGATTGGEVGRNAAPGAGAADLLRILLDPHEAAAWGLPPETSSRLAGILGHAREPALLRPILASIVMRAACAAEKTEGSAGERKRISSRIPDWLLDRIAYEKFAATGDAESGRLDALLAGIAATWRGLLIAERRPRASAEAEAKREATLPPGSAGEPIRELFADPDVSAFLAIHEHAGVVWLSKERLEWMLRALVPAALLAWRSGTEPGDRGPRGAVRVLDAAERMRAVAAGCGYRVAEMVERLAR